MLHFIWRDTKQIYILFLFDHLATLSMTAKNTAEDGTASTTTTTTHQFKAAHFEGHYTPLMTQSLHARALC
jgi:hypothetical protein